MARALSVMIIRLLVVAVLSSVVLLESGCRRSSRSVILDHDGGIDDYVALLMLLSSPDRRLRGVTVSFGNSNRDDAVETTRRILATYGRHVPVGVFQPSDRGKNEFPPEWRKTSAAVNGLKMFRPGAYPSAQDASSVMRRALEGGGRRKMEILVTGPLTNLAAALRKRERMIGHIRRVVVMGGAVRVAGNAPGGEAEYNIFVDPEAAGYIFSLAARGLSVELVPLDATNHLPVTRLFIERLMKAAPAPARQAGEILSLAGAGSDYYLWDAGTALALLQPDLFSFESLRLRVTPEGRTVEDGDGYGPIRVAVGVNPDARPLEELAAILEKGAVQ